ncbi:hypothetical protein BDR04DRAFT_1112468 [Suillus decipiens]|nr:hypothetical protein BDR04DRAFT_1112468 [Suillus decipiens]
MNDLDLSLPSRAYPTPSSSTYRRAGIFLVVYRSEISSVYSDWISLDLVALTLQLSHAAEILHPSYSTSFGISPILKVARLVPSRGLNFTQGFSKQNRNNSNIYRGLFFEIRHEWIGLSLKLDCVQLTNFSVRRSVFVILPFCHDTPSILMCDPISKIHGDGYLPFPQTLTNLAYWSDSAEVMGYRSRSYSVTLLHYLSASTQAGSVLSTILVHGVHLMIELAARINTVSPHLEGFCIEWGVNKIAEPLNWLNLLLRATTLHPYLKESLARPETFILFVASSLIAW